MRITTFHRLCAAALALLCSFATAAIAQQTSASTALKIPAQPLRDALTALGRQTGLQVIYTSNEVTDALKAPPLEGTFTAQAALSRLLEGSGLTYEFLDARTVAIRGKSVSSSGVQSLSPAVGEGQGGDPAIRLAQSSSSETLIQPHVATTERTDLTSKEDKSAQIQEIIVTAQKKTENLQNVPVPVTVLNTEALAENGQSRLQDYFATVPGLSLITGGTSGGGGTQTLAIRGITTGAGTNPSVGLTIDDVPYGSSTILGAGAELYPDIDPSDLERVEVLRGPQGTLYGASSIGGLIKFVTKDPSTDGFSGRMQVLGDAVEHGEAGYGVRGAVNVPLSDEFAIRASAFTRRDPGYVDNVLTGQNNVNRVNVSGGRFAALWHISDSVSIKVTALLQNTDGYGTPAVDASVYSDGTLYPTLGDLKQARERGTEAFSSMVRLYTATVTAKLDGLEFTSISGYGANTYRDRTDLTQGFGFLAQSVFQVPGGVLGVESDTNKVTQEFRLSSASGQTIEWLAGAFYTHENSPADSYIGAIDPATGTQVGIMENVDNPSSLSEYALFGDLTAHFTDRFDVQFGARESHNRQTYDETDTGPLIVTSPAITPTEVTTGNAFTYLLTPRFKISPDLMVYARLASGYREGGPNVNAVLGNIPLTYEPDKTKNYELGIKGDALDRRLTFDASVYYIDWSRIQTTLYNATTRSSYTANAGKAKSQGLELSVQARPTKGLTIAVSTSVSDAKLTQDLPPSPSAAASAGNPLPYSSRFSGNFSVEQEIALTRNWTGFLGGSLSYVGAREGEFAPPGAPRLRFPAYAEARLSVGARYETWTFNLFVNNVADRRGIVGGATPYAESQYDMVFIQPRTVGLSLARGF